mmetsp:Transcript_17910/g.26510  ORF Transcript_17910/g.26510 Transcript_17910/m.26510 type:complete len:84 (-) Transcript_17910:50-301(-)
MNVFRVAYKKARKQVKIPKLTACTGRQDGISSKIPKTKPIPFVTCRVFTTPKDLKVISIKGTTKTPHGNIQLNKLAYTESTSP